MKKKHKIILIFVMALALGLVSFGCQSSPKSDSRLYECVYFTVGGEDRLGDMVYYSMELRSNGSLITRFKNNSTSASSRDKYEISGERFVMIVDMENKEYQIINGLIVMRDKQEFDGKMTLVVRKFAPIRA